MSESQNGHRPQSFHEFLAQAESTTEGGSSGLSVSGSGTYYAQPNPNAEVGWLEQPAPARPAAFRRERLEALCRELLAELGEDPEREGLQDTPRRWARWWLEFIDYDPGNTETAFESVTSGQVVAVQGIRVWSLCEHHLLPFWADITIAYVPTERVLGLSKFARIAQQAAHRLQLQERLTEQIAAEVERITASPSVAVLASGEHLCMTMRGIKAPARMASSVLRGLFADPRSAARSELFLLLGVRQ